jgi:hypothetical protein
MLVSLLPYIIGSALVPVYGILVILLLKSPGQGLLKAVAFVAGITATRLLQGLIFGFVFTESAASTDDSSGKGLVVSTLLLVLGLYLLITAYKQWRGEDDPDAPPPKWLTMMDSLTPLKACVIGVGLPLVGVKLWIFTLGALGTIAEAQLGQPGSTIAYLLFIWLAQSLLLIPILIRILIPARSQSILDGLSDWLAKNNRPIVMVVSLVFGVYFLYLGISGLLA